MTMKTERRLQWAADMIEIQQLAYRYAICADAKDAAGIVALFAPTSLRIWRANRARRAGQTLFGLAVEIAAMHPQCWQTI
jgi:hypothetical protein